MWREALVLLYQLLTLGRPLGARRDVSSSLDAGVVTPENCSLECVRQEGSGCEYCRIDRADVERALGFHSAEAFGSCIPWPCYELLGGENPEVCEHYVHAPSDVTVEVVPDQNPTSDTIIVSWKPSYYGISFLRGFQVSLQALGGTQGACQLSLFHRSLSLPASHAQKVYKSDPFPGLSLGAEYAVTVMSLPVPEQWDRFYHKKIFSTRTCAEKNGLELCKRDWYPEHIEVQQEGTDVIVTFNLAPPDLGIRSYFSLCYGDGKKKYMDIEPKSTINTTHHSYRLLDLQEGTNYTCEMAANEVDAVRKKFSVQVHVKHEAAPPRVASPSLALMLPVGMALLAIFVVLLAVLTRRRPKLSMKKVDIRPDIMEQHQNRGMQVEVTSPAGGRPNPPRLLICYSSRDGPAHVRVVLQLGAFLQQHMATQVSLDLWDSLSLAEEGALGWHCRRIQESDFILVVCSRGLNHRPARPDPDSEDSDSDSESVWGASGSVAAVALIGEEIGRAKAKGQELSKYMAAVFEYSDETDVPAEMRLVSLYSLPRDLPLLFSQLHRVALHRPGGYLKVEHLTEEGFSQLPAGAALQWAVHEAETASREKQQQRAMRREGGVVALHSGEPRETLF